MFAAITIPKAGSMITHANFVVIVRKKKRAFLIIECLLLSIISIRNLLKIALKKFFST